MSKEGNRGKKIRNKMWLDRLENDMKIAGVDKGEIEHRAL